ncbi:MAG: CBS domain-containing protein [Leptospirales bacterium]|jgi:CBS domain-containing protein
MNVKVDDLMKTRVMTATPHQTAGHLRGVLKEHRVNFMPVVGPQQEVLGVISANDLLGDIADGAPLSGIMTKKVYSVPQYEDVSTAARIMRNHRIHHLVVIHENKLAGVLSSFDLLQLVEEHRFVMKNPPSGNKHTTGKRAKAEA